MPCRGISPEDSSRQTIGRRMTRMPVLASVTPLTQAQVTMIELPARGEDIGVAHSGADEGDHGYDRRLLLPHAKMFEMSSKRRL